MKSSGLRLKSSSAGQVVYWFAIPRFLKKLLLLWETRITPNPIETRSCTFTSMQFCRSKVPHDLRSSGIYFDARSLKRSAELKYFVHLRRTQPYGLLVLYWTLSGLALTTIYPRLKWSENMGIPSSPDMTPAVKT